MSGLQAENWNTFMNPILVRPPVLDLKPRARRWSSETEHGNNKSSKQQLHQRQHQLLTTTLLSGGQMSKRKEVLEKKKAIAELLKAASFVKDHLAPFQSFHRYDRNGLSLYLESGRGNKLSSYVKQYIQNLLKVNMEEVYGPEWPTEEKVKRREMVSPEACYIFVHEVLDAGVGVLGLVERPLVGFVQFRFTLEEELPVLYVYEIQLERRVQGKGLGEFLMQLIVLIACKSRMSAVVLTVQKANVAALNFYTSKLRYSISSISPSRVDPFMGIEKSYEILCKALDDEAKAMFEESR